MPFGAVPGVRRRQLIYLKLDSIYFPVKVGCDSSGGKYTVKASFSMNSDSLISWFNYEGHFYSMQRDNTLHK